MKKKRRKFNSAEKAAIALEAIREVKTSAEIAREFQVHAGQVSRWKEQALANLTSVFEKSNQTQDHEREKEKLYQEVGRLQTELSWLKKKYQSWSQK